MSDRPPATQVGYTQQQRAAMRAVEEEGMLDLIGSFLNRANALADRLDEYARTAKPSTRERPGRNDGPATAT